MNSQNQKSEIVDAQPWPRFCSSKVERQHQSYEVASSILTLRNSLSLILEIVLSYIHLMSGKNIFVCSLIIIKALCDAAIPVLLLIYKPRNSGDYAMQFVCFKQCRCFPGEWVTGKASV